jgi:hypothetical protein
MSTDWTYTAVPPQVGAIEVRIRSEEYTSDEAVSFCWERLDRLQDLIDKANAWGVQIDGNTYAGQGTVAGQFVVGRYGTFFELIVSTETA